MIKKSNTLRIFGAIVFCFVFVFAFRMERIQEPALPVPADDVESVYPDVHPMNTLARSLSQPTSFTRLPLEMIDSETLWLARAIYSETKRPNEQILVAWVIRNRVETGFRGKRSYQSVVLDPFQFSAFRFGSDNRTFYESLDHGSRISGWQQALQIAHNIRHVNDNYRPFSPETRHFYSERSMLDRGQPAWIGGESALDITSVMEIDQHRFRFYEGIS